MSNSDLTIFDAQFSINQFGGNQSLLVKILDKFILQYQYFDASITEYLQHENLQAAKQQIHSIKGVSGNLGMKALHNACKEFELELSHRVTGHSVEIFLTVFKQTLSAVQNYSVENSINTINAIETAPQQYAKTSLIAALKRKEFISDSKMQNYTQSLDFSSEQLHKLNQAIDNLDYACAIALLE